MDRNFIATNYTDKKVPLNPATALVRFQFLEMLVRLAQDKFVHSNIMKKLMNSIGFIFARQDNEYIERGR